MTSAVNNDNQNNLTPAQTQALKQTRRRWLIAIATNAPLPFLALPFTGTQWIEEQPGQAAMQALAVALVLGIIGVFGGLFARNQTYKAHWQADAVTPAGYLRGNTIFFIAVNAGAFAVFLAGIITGYPAATFAAAPVFIGLLAMNLPSEKPMLPAAPRIDFDGAPR